jgi:hypothetical protein
MSVALIVTVATGFAPTFYMRGVYHPGVPLSRVLRIHGIVLTSWMLLFSLQTILVARGSVALHRRLGWAMTGLAAAIILVMSGAIIEQLRRSPPTIPAPFALAFGMFDVLVFATLVSLAIYWRKRADWHKRLMLSATILLVEAAVVRIVAFHGFHEPLYLMVSQYASALFFFALCFAHDLKTGRKIHRATVLGLSLILADQIVQPIVLAWRPWTSFAQWLQELVT